MRIDDPAAVARQYATEHNLEARRSLYANAEGPDPREVAFDAVAELGPGLRIRSRRASSVVVATKT